jgi:ankyrin repeat protein
MKRPDAIAAVVVVLCGVIVSVRMALLVRSARLDNALTAAVEANNAGRVDGLLREGASGDARKQEHGLSAAYLLNLLLGRRRVPRGPSALQIAVEHRNPAIVTALLNHGARDVNAVFPHSEAANSDQTLLESAVSTGSPEIARALLEHGANAATRDESGASILVTANDPECARLLLDHGVSVSSTDRYGSTILMSAAGKDSALLKLYLDHGAPADAPNLSGTTPLMLAAQSGDAENVKLLLAHGANPNRVSHSGMTALKFAGDLESPEARDEIRALLKNAGESR